ncbi:MAG TPA: NAD(P)H-quinone oxidoreductase [Anditalea sp.]|nr:NAD(P)H-quinone oxidoreductase [Anditalea sp.]
MRAIIITEPGDPEVLQIREIPKPTPKADEILIEVVAAGINRPDIAQRKGRYPAPKGAPTDIPGLEVSGRIVELGEEVIGFNIGDEVCALLAGGGYAEYAVAPYQQCLPIPKGISIEDAASLPETFFTVWNNIFDIGNFKKGETVLIHGGSSGIGVSGIQMIKAMGGNVYITAGTDHKCKTCLELGADIAINYKTHDFELELNSLNGNQSVDIVLDMIGGLYTAKNLNLLKPYGRIVMINAMKGKNAEVDLIQIMINRLSLTGSTLRSQSVEYKGKIATSLKDNIWPLIGEKIKPVIYKTFPLENAAEAHDLMESSNHIGKIILLANKL